MFDDVVVDVVLLLYSKHGTESDRITDIWDIWTIELLLCVY